MVGGGGRLTLSFFVKTSFWSELIKLNFIISTLAGLKSNLSVFNGKKIYICSYFFLCWPMIGQSLRVAHVTFLPGCRPARDNKALAYDMSRHMSVGLRLLKYEIPRHRILLNLTLRYHNPKFRY